MSVRVGKRLSSIDPLLPQRINSPLEVDGVLKHDGGREQIQPAGAVALLLEAPVAISPTGNAQVLVSAWLHDWHTPHDRQAVCYGCEECPAVDGPL